MLDIYRDYFVDSLSRQNMQWQIKKSQNTEEMPHSPIEEEYMHDFSKFSSVFENNLFFAATLTISIDFTLAAMFKVQIQNL